MSNPLPSEIRCLQMACLLCNFQRSSKIFNLCLTVYSLSPLNIILCRQSSARNNLRYFFSCYEKKDKYDDKSYLSFAISFAIQSYILQQIPKYFKFTAAIPHKKVGNRKAGCPYPFRRPSIFSRVTSFTHTVKRWIASVISSREGIVGAIRILESLGSTP